MYILIFYKVLY